MSVEFRNLMLWLAGGTLALLAALQWTTAAYVDGVFVPYGNDAFYHARRILDAVADPAAYYQFDPLIHAPQGSWLTWPWAYDLIVADVIRALVALGISPDHERALMYIPAAWVYVNVALLLALARSLRMGDAACGVLVVCFALSPLTQALHGVGQIDHHYLELSFVLASAWLTIAWAGRPHSRKLALGLALVLASAPAFHNGLFILQMPVLGACTLLWCRGKTPAPAALAVFATSLVALTLVVVLPSEPFRAGFFEFYTLSWFHLYVSCAVALCSLLLARLAYSRANLARLALIAVVLLVPLITQIDHGGRFLRADFVNLAEMPEARSVFTIAADAGGLHQLTTYYSWLIMLVPLMLAWCAYQLLRGRQPRLIVLATFATFGLLVLSQQLRLHYFGWYTLPLLPLLYADASFARGDRPRRGALLSVAVLVLASLSPGIPLLLHTPLIGGDRNYALLSPIFAPLARACREHPGVVLAEHNLGHPLRFHTDCAVVANNMIMTPQHFAKLVESAALLQLTPAALRTQAPWIRYLLVVNSPKYGAALKQRLLMNDEPPPGYRLITRVNLPASQGREYRIAAAYAIEPAIAPASVGHPEQVSQGPDRRAP